MEINTSAKEKSKAVQTVKRTISPEWGWKEIIDIEKFIQDIERRWECIRRNDGYKKSYARWSELIKRSEYKPDDKRVEYDSEENPVFTEYLFANTKAYKFQKKCCIKYGFPISFKPLPSPNTPFNEDVKQRLTQKEGFIYEGHCSPVRCYFQEQTRWIEHSAPPKYQTFHIEIDFEKIRKKDDLKKVVCEMISRGYDYHNKQYGGKKTKDKTNYDFMFKIGDLWKELNEALKPGEPKPIYEDIANRLSDDFKKNNIKPNDKNVCNYIKKYEYLISGGFDDIFYL